MTEPEGILNNPLLNKGTGFTREERAEFGLEGLLPYHVSTIEEQVVRRYDNFCSQKEGLAKYLFLNSLQNRNETLFYRLVLEHIDEMLPYIYTPTVGDVSQQYSILYREHRGIYLSYPLREKIPQIIENLKKEVDVIVVTDGERILGLGDLGVGGMAIPLGKLALYTLFGGIHPGRTLPVFLDVGTNERSLLDDPLYLGWRHERVRGKEYDAFVDLFVKAIKNRYPQVLLQWEDFAKPHAKPLLERYRKSLCSFNDDIQGTAAVVLSALFTSARKKGEMLKDQRIVVLGGGSAGIGICEAVVEAMIAEGATKEQAYRQFFIVDRVGLLHTQLPSLESAQKPFAQPAERLGTWNIPKETQVTLYDVVHHAHPTVLIGVSAQTGAFTEEIIKEMARHVKVPVILPLSNPTSCSEAHPQDLSKWTGGQAIVATGSPFEGTAQCNNVYVFPGLGLGVVAAKATFVSDGMLRAAAHTLSDFSPLLKNGQKMLFPYFDHLRAVSRAIAIAVGKKAQEEGCAPPTTEGELEAAVDRTMWFPDY